LSSIAPERTLFLNIFKVKEKGNLSFHLVTYELLIYIVVRILKAGGPEQLSPLDRIDPSCNLCLNAPSRELYLAHAKIDDMTRKAHVASPCPRLQIFRTRSSSTGSGFRDFIRYGIAQDSHMVTPSMSKQSIEKSGTHFNPHLPQVDFS
jgi:hypothetical protein